MQSVTHLTGRYTAAVDLARQLHAAEVRKETTIPYVAHPLAVSALVLEHGGSEDQAIAALLHDTAEDHGGRARLDALRAEFGGVVADLVEACSDSLVADRTAKVPWWERKVAFLQRLEVESVEAALVSAADKLHNARAVLADYRIYGDDLFSRFNPDAGRAGTLWYYTRVSEILGNRLADAPGALLAAELARTVSQITQHCAGLGDDPDAEIAQGLVKEADLRAAWARR